MKPLTEARIAIIHEWMVHYGGGVERVAASMRELFPKADHFALVHDREGLRKTPLGEIPVQTSFIQALPRAKKNYQVYLPLMPFAIERFNLTSYDIVISLSHAVAKGVITSPDQLHICYLQARNLKYAYEDRFFYPRGGIRRLAEDFLLSSIRVWDKVASTRPDVTVANSQYVSNWHSHRHGVSSHVIYPPVDVTFFSKHFPPKKGDYYTTVGRLEPYKRIDLIVEAFSAIDSQLMVVGDGSLLNTLQKMAGSNIRFTGRLDSASVAQVVAKAKAFVFASREDFGIAPLEAQASGTPVIAYGEGGALETIVGWPAPRATGVFFDAQTPEALVAAVKLFEAHAAEFDPEACRRNAERFGRERFQKEFRAVVESLWGTFQGGEGLK